MPYSCKSASSTVTVFNRIYISPSFHISFILISQIFFRPFKLPVLDRTTSIHLNRSSFVRSVCDVDIYLCIVSRSGSVAHHHTFFLNASIYDVSSFLPLPPHQQFPYNVYMYQRYSLPSRISVQVVPIQCAIQYCDQRFDNTVVYSVGSRHYENDSL